MSKKLKRSQQGLVPVQPISSTDRTRWRAHLRRIAEEAARRDRAAFLKYRGQ